MCLFLGVSIVVFVFLSLKYDRSRYDYGWGCAFCNNSLPFKVKPKFTFEYPQSFTLIDDDNFELIGVGFRYKRSSFKIDDFLGYGYNDTSILVKAADSLGNIKYLTSYETDYKNSKGNAEISFEDVTEKYFQQVKGNYNWTDLREGKAGQVNMKRLISFAGIIISGFFLLWQLFKKKPQHIAK